MPGVAGTKVPRCKWKVRLRGLRRKHRILWMLYPHTEVYIHCVWTTLNRAPLILPDLESRLYSILIEQCANLGCHGLAVGGIEDHVHLLVRMNATCSIAALMKQTKGASSHFVNQVLKSDIEFRWQSTYGALSVSPSGVDRVMGYIRNQKTHHTSSALIDQLEVTGCSKP